MASGTTIVGAVAYDASIDLPQLRKSVAEADKIVEKSYKNQANAAKKAAKSSAGGSGGATSKSGAATSYDAQTRVNAIKREAQETARTLSTYTPQIQKQFLTVERANNQVASATARSTAAIQKYGVGSTQATQATNSLNVAVGNQAQQQSKLTSMLDGTYKSQNGLTGAMNESITAIGGVVAGVLTLQATIQVIKSSVQAANEYQSSLTGLSRLSQRFGEDNKLATDSAKELAADGLITISTAANGLQKLLTAGVGLPDAIKLMQGYKDQAAFGRSKTIDLDTAVGNLAESFYTENSAIGNLSGQTENWNQILEYGASALGKNVSQLTQKERVTAKLIGQQRLNNLVQGDAAVYAETDAGAQQELNAILKNMQVTVGRVTNALSGGLVRSLGGLDVQTQNSVISFGAGVATFGAFIVLAPRVVAGIKFIVASMRALTIASALSSGGLTVLLGAVAGLAGATYIGNLIDGLDDAEGLSGDMAENVNTAAGGLGTAAANAKDTAKQIAKINEQMQEARDNYRYSLAQLVKEKNENIATLTRTLTEEERTYKNAYNERLTSFNKSQNEELLTHEQKTRELQNQIDFLTQYNTAANRQQLTELQFALARENAEYERSTQLRKDEFNAQTQSAKTEYEARRAENQKKLNEELALLRKHRQDVLSVRNVMLLDEIDSLKKQRNEQLKSLGQQKQDIISQLSEAGSIAGAKSGSAFKSRFIKSVELSRKDAERVFAGLGPGEKVYKQTYKDGRGKTVEIITGTFASGGFTGRGKKYDVAGIVHAGEYVLPKEQVNQTTGMPDWSKIGGSSQNINVNLSLSGVMTSSKSDERAIATRMAKLINEAVKAKTGSPAIVGV
jgi:hypothetical protein